MKETIKRLFCTAFALILLFGAVPKAAALGSFSDITDQTTAINAEVLQMMGVVNGTGGSQFNPNGSLTRAQFCKMAVEVMQQGDRVLVHKNYTIFPDVKPSHWASGYVNLASSIEIGGGSTGGEGSTAAASTRLISGVGDGTFRPDATITYGQAVTILMRMLGYGDTDVGAVWPDGYLDAAMLAGLTKNIKASGSSAVTRGQAAQLFVNLLSCDKKSGGKYYEEIATPKENVVLLDANAKDLAGLPMMKTSEGDYYLAGNPGSGILSGYKGTLLVSKDNAQEAITFLPAGSGVSREITIAKAEPTAITDQNGTVYTIDTDAQMYQGNAKKSYAENYMFLRSGTMATIFINDRNRIDTIFVGSTTSDDAVVVQKDGSTEGFQLLTDRTDYRLVKHGEEVSQKMIRAYDVATYSASNNTIYLSDNRITVYYADAYPSPQAPSYIKANGIVGSAGGGQQNGTSPYQNYLEVMPSAVADVSEAKVGTTVTLLLTENNKVAGISDSSTIRNNAVAFVDSEGKATLFNGLSVEGTIDEKYHGQLVMVTSTKSGISVSKFSGNSVRGDFDPVKKTVGENSLAADVRIYQTTSGNQIKEITLNDVKDIVKKENVLYARKNYADKVDILILSATVGDTLYYARAYVTETTTTTGEGDEATTTTKTTTVLKNGKNDKIAEFTVDRGLSTGQWIGFSLSPTNPNLMTSMVVLKEIKNVSVSDFRDNKTAYVNGTVYTVGSGIDACCYNRSNQTWLDSFNRALSYGGTMSIYVDDNNVIRAVELGTK